MALQDIEYPACPEHEISMVPHTFDTRDASLLQGTVEGFRCPNLDCSIVYVEGTQSSLTIPFYLKTMRGKLNKIALECSVLL